MPKRSILKEEPAFIAASQGVMSETLPDNLPSEGQLAKSSARMLGKVCLVTGGGTGIGRASALKMAEVKRIVIEVAKDMAVRAFSIISSVTSTSAVVSPGDDDFAAATCAQVAMMLCAFAAPDNKRLSSALSDNA